MPAQIDPDKFFLLVEHYAIHIAFLIVLCCWLFRHVKSEIRKR